MLINKQSILPFIVRKNMRSYIYFKDLSSVEELELEKDNNGQSSWKLSTITNTAVHKHG